MGLIAGRCFSCGGTIKFNENKKSGFCPYCGTPYISEEIVNNYNTYNNTYYNIENANIRLDSQNIEENIKAAEVYLIKIKNYTQAESMFKDITKKAPTDYRGWWGLARAKTNNMTNYNIGQTKFSQLTSYEIKNVFRFAPGEKAAEIKNAWNNYTEQITKVIDGYESEKALCQDKKNANTQKYKNKIHEAKNEIIYINQETEEFERKLKNFYKIRNRIIFGCICYSILEVILISLVSKNFLYGLSIGAITAFFLGSILIIPLFLFSDIKQKKYNKQKDEEKAKIKIKNQQVKQIEDELDKANKDIDKQIEEINYKILNG